MHKGDFLGLFGIRLGRCPGIIPEKNQLSAILFQVPVFFSLMLLHYELLSQSYNHTYSIRNVLNLIIHLLEHIQTFLVITLILRPILYYVITCLQKNSVVLYFGGELPER